MPPTGTTSGVLAVGKLLPNLVAEGDATDAGKQDDERKDQAHHTHDGVSEDCQPHDDGDKDRGATPNPLTNAQTNTRNGEEGKSEGQVLEKSRQNTPVRPDINVAPGQAAVGGLVVQLGLVNQLEEGHRQPRHDEET